MSKLFDHEFRIGLLAAVRTLTEVQAAWETDPQEALEKARGAALVLRARARKNGFPQIAAAAAPVEDAPAAVVPKLVTRLARVVEEVCSLGWDETLNVLIVQGFSNIGEDLRSRLEAPNRAILVAKTAADAQARIEANEVALVVLDLVLPDMDGRNLLSRLREDPRTESVPIVVVADGGGHEFQSECFALGADQYFEKSLDLDMLGVAIASTLHRSLQKQRDSQHEFETDLLSRDGLHRSLKKTLARAARKHFDVCVALLEFDVECLDTVPAERLPALVGRVASMAARAVSRALRPDDLLARWSEREIVAVFRRTNSQGATRALERAREALGSEVFREGSVAFRVDFAAGLTEVKGQPTLEDILAEADRVLLAEREASSEGRTSLNDTPSTPRRKATIAVVGSEGEIAFRLRRKLEAYDVRHVSSESGALELASLGRVALILLDAKLRGANTFDLLKRLRRTSGLERTPILVTADRGRDPDVARAFEYGADDYILKPCSTANLVARIRRSLRRAATQPSNTGLVVKAGAIAGLFSGDQLFEFVQMLGLNSKTGRLKITSDKLSGHVDFRQGKVCGAWTSRGREGPEATHELLGMRAGRFEFTPAGEPSEGKPSMLASVNTLLLDAMRLRDESSLQGD